MTTILITGAGRGIGYEMARQSLAKGWEVLASVRSKDAAERLVKDLGDRITPLVFDVTDHSAINAVASGLDQPIDILINNAGIIGPARQSTLDMDFDGMAQTFAINTLAPLAVTQAFLPHLRRSDCPRILVISSQMGRMAYKGSDRIAYRASKSAVNKVFQGLAEDLKSEAIPVLIVHPGWVKTDMGGPSAALTPDYSASCVLGLAADLEIGQTGDSVNWDGSPGGW